MGVCTDFSFSLRPSERKIQQEGTWAHLFPALLDETLKESSLRYLWNSGHQISKKSGLKASHCPVWDKLAEGRLRKEPFPSQCCVFKPSSCSKTPCCSFGCSASKQRVLKADLCNLQGPFCSTSRAKWLSSREAIGKSVVCVQMLSLSAFSQDHFQIKREF